VASEDPWYEIVDGGELEQGDFIINLPVFIPDYTSDILQKPPDPEVSEHNISGVLYRYNVVVMNQTCDLEQHKLRFALVCPYWPLEYLGRRESKFLEPKIQEEIRRGQMYGYYMLNACELDEKEQGIQVLEFGSTYSVSFEFLRQFVSSQGRRLRLRSPYKESMSHAFGNYFSRVALYSEIQPFRRK
jgi:hypothetical protein